MAAPTLSLSSDPVHCTLTRAQWVTVTIEQSVTMTNTLPKTGTLALLATVVNAVEARLIATEVRRPSTAREPEPLSLSSSLSRRDRAPLSNSSLSRHKQRTL